MGGRPARPRYRTPRDGFPITGLLSTRAFVIRRDDASGRLAFIQVLRDGVSVDSLSDAVSIAVSPDGGHVYVASWHDDALTVFSRNGTTGKLTFVEAHKDEVGGIVSLNGARSVVVSPDNKHVYVASWVDDTVSVFSRNESTGELTFVAAHKDGVGGVDGLDTADGIAVSPDGAHVYVGSYGDDAVAVFARFMVYLPLALRNH